MPWMGTRELDTQGRCMRRQTLLCLKSLGACSALWAAGCGLHDSPALSGPDAIPAPRRIELPANIRPLQVEAVEREQVDGGSVPAQYQQPPSPTSSQPQVSGPALAPPAQSIYNTAQQPPAAPYQPSPAHALHTQPATTQENAAMQAVAQQAMQIANRAATMAQRGMLFSAKTELIKGLTLITQALDVQEGTMMHSWSLGAGLTALHEARDFATADSQSSGPLNVTAIAATHQTKLPMALAPGGSPVVAQQQYFGYAQVELTEAAGGVPAASEILYRLGRLQTAMTLHEADPGALHGPQSIVFHQAALATNSGNWLAANELGVLYARYGQLPLAKQLLVQSVTIHPHLQGWHNLATVHRRLGEIDLAQRAEAEMHLLENQPGQNAAANDMIRWVDPKTFAASGGSDINWPATVAAKPTASTAATRR